MAETEATDTGNIVMEVEEVEGDQICTRNYRFSKIGESVPITPDADFKFDTNSLPSRPLAVSDRFGVVFVAHSSGFCVAKTKDIMNMAEEWKNEESGSSIQELSVVDVSIGKVSILAVSTGSSILAVSEGSNLYFFSVAGLLNKDQEPSFSKSLNDSSCIKDMQWITSLKDCYAVLTTDGSLYYGAGQDDLNSIMDDVDAFDWSMDGKFSAVAKSNYLSILSSKFKEKMRIMLSFKSWAGDADGSVVKVDSVKWVRPDCIILGCYQLSADGVEEGYLVQVITVKDGKITNASSSPIALTFSDAFLALNDDAVPFGSGPYMFLSYLDDRALAFIANKKNTDQHIVLLGWPSDENNGAAMIEISNDAWLPTIDLQSNSDDNLILGLAVDKVSHDAKVKITLGEEDTEVSPCCVLLCVTVDGRLFMFHFASATGPSSLPEVAVSVSDEEESSASISSKHGLLSISNDEKRIGDQVLPESQPAKVKVDEPSGKAGYGTPLKNGHEQVNPTAFSQLFKGGAQPDDSGVKSKRDQPESPFSPKQDRNLEDTPFKMPQPLSSGVLVKDVKQFENQECAEVKSSADTVLNFSADKSNTLFGTFPKDLGVSTKPSGNVASASLHGSSGSFSSGAVLPSKTFDLQSSTLPHAGMRGNTESSGYIGSASLFSSSGSLSSGGIFSSKNFDVKSSPSPHAIVQGNRPDTSASIADFSSGSQKFSFSKTASAPSTSTNMFGQGVSTGAGVPNSLPMVSNAQSSLGSSDFKIRSDKGNHRTHTPSRQLNSEPNLSEQRSVEEMAKQLDILLDSIEQPGGFYDSSVALHEASVTALEDGIWAVSDRCRMWKGSIDQGLEEIQLLLDKTVQVLARKIYLEAIVKQATDSQYWDIWNRQKLSSELEMKRQHILEINQNLTNQLIDLERHLNTLALQRFGDKDDAQTSRRSLQMKHGPSRQIQSLRSLHNTMNAQLAAAEKLSESLSKQMAALSVQAEPVKRQNVKKELFETIGISYDGSSFSPSDEEKTREIPSNSKALISLSTSAAAKEHLKKNQSAGKNSEPETVRRRRDSLDRNWATFEPPKTTVKRLLLQEDRQMSPSRSLLPTTTQKLNRLSEGSVASPYVPGSRDAQIKQDSKGQSNTSSLANNREVAKDSHDPTTERSRSRLNFSLKSGTANDSKSSQQPQSLPDQPSSNPTRAQATNIFQKKPIEFSESSSKDVTSKQIEFSQATNIFQKKPIEFSESSSKDVTSKPTSGNGSQRPIATENSSFWPKKSQESSLLVSNASSTPAFSGKSFSLLSSTKESQLGRVVSSSATPLSPIPVTSSATPSIFKDINPSRLSINSGIKLGAAQMVSPPGSSTSAPSLPSTPSFGAPKEPVSSSFATTLTNIESNTPKPEVSKLNTKTNESSTPKFGLKPDENSSTQSSPSQPTFFSGTLNLKLGSEPTPTSSFSESPLKVSAASSPALTVSNSKPEPPSVAAPTSFSPALSSSADGVGRENDNSDAGFAQEDEMEEEAPAASQLALENLGGFGLGSAPNPAAPRQNPFGASFGNTAANAAPITSFTMTAPTGGLFRPASFNIQSSPPSQPSQPASFGGFSGGFGANTNQNSTGQGFGQPAQIGSGQQALGSVLGSFGQSRQLGAGLPGSVASASPFGGGQSAGGFATASSGGGGGFANLASGGGGFGSLATVGGGFAAAATGGGGFAAASTGSGGFGAAPSAGGGFAAAATGGGFGGSASGGFGGFSSQGGGAFSTFGSTGGTARPPSELFTQMRK